MIRVENIRNMAKESDVKRFLIDREWPKDVVRSIPRNEESGQTRKTLARIHWSPELAPSPELWKWFSHDPEKIRRFRGRYFRELQKKKKNWVTILQESGKNEVALLYHGKQEKYAHLTPAQFLKEYLDDQLKMHHIPEPAKMRAMNLQGQGISVPVGKAISQKHELPLKKEMSFKPKQKLTLVPAGKRRML